MKLDHKKVNKRTKKIVEYLLSRPSIRILTIEREIGGLPETTIYKAMFNGRNIAVKHLDKIEKHLMKYGFEK